MNAASNARCLRGNVVGREARGRHRRGIIVSLLVNQLCIVSWITGELYWLHNERESVTVLERDYGAGTLAHVIDSTEADWLPSIDLRELQFGRLYAPIERVSLHRNVDRRAWKLLAKFRYLTDLTIQECRVEPGTEEYLGRLSSLKDLKVLYTQASLAMVRNISCLRSLESLDLRGTGMKGEWMVCISGLPAVRTLCLDDMDLSDGAAEALGGMTGLTNLQLSNVKVDAKFGPALARLKKLDALVIVDAPFDDAAAKYLADVKEIQIMYLGSTAITDQGMESIGKLVNLWRLSISHTQVGDSGVRHLTGLKKLMDLDLARTRVTNACLPTLAALPALRMTRVTDTAISVSSPGFIGVLDENDWFANETIAKAARDNSEPE